MIGFKLGLKHKQEQIIRFCMIKFIYKIYLCNVFFLKQLYKLRDESNSSNSIILSFGLLFLNFHSLLIILEFGFNLNIGVANFWAPTQTPKVGYGYLLGLVLALFFYILIAFLERRFTQVEKIKIMRSVILKKKKRVYTVLYVVSTLIVFIYTVGWMITSIIPKGGL